MGLLVGLFVLGAQGSLAFAETQKMIDVQSVQNVLNQTGASWTAKHSWVTDLTQPEMQRLMGVQKPPQGNLDFEATGTSILGTLPALDWRNANGINWLSPVMNQGNCGSCVAFAAVATLEAQTSIAAGIPWLRPTFSSQMLFACGGGGCDTGWYPESAANFLQRTGVPDEACMPYTSGSTGHDLSCSQKCADSGSRTFKVAGYQTTGGFWGGGSVEDVLKALTQGPVMTTMRVFGDFMTYSSGIYKHVTGEMLGGHAISIVGFDRAKRAWLIRNSWGKEWGMGGFAWVSWDDTSGVGSETWSFDIASTQGHVTVKSPADREFVSGKYQLVANVAGASSKSIQFHLKDASGSEALVANCTVQATKNCSSVLDTTRLKEGRYEIFAETSSPGIKSQVREFFVLNHVPQMKLSFKGAGVDLNAPLTGRPEFEILATSTYVPIQYVDFVVQDMSGKTVYSKRNDSVLEHMKLGWRTQFTPNGRYKIFFRGVTQYKGTAYTATSNVATVTLSN